MRLLVPTLPSKGGRTTALPSIAAFGGRTLGLPALQHYALPVLPATRTTAHRYARAPSLRGRRNLLLPLPDWAVLVLFSGIPYQRSPFGRWNCWTGRQFAAWVDSPGLPCLVFAVDTCWRLYRTGRRSGRYYWFVPPFHSCCLPPWVLNYRAWALLPAACHIIAVPLPPYLPSTWPSHHDLAVQEFLPRFVLCRHCCQLVFGFVVAGFLPAFRDSGRLPFTPSPCRCWSL